MAAMNLKRSMFNVFFISLTGQAEQAGAVAHTGTIQPDAPLAHANR